jgi:hypothetical protein
MPNPIKYSTGSETNALKKGNFFFGTGDVGKGPSDVTGYYQGVDVPQPGYVIYMNKEGAPGGLSYHSAANDSELIAFTNNLAGQSYTTVNQCLVYFAGQSDKVVLNRDYEGIVTDGLVFNLDAGFTASYPKNGTTWYDVGGSNNGTLTNGPTFNSDNSGSIVFDGVDDYVQTTLLFNKENFTYSAWFKRTGNGGGAIDDNIIDSFDGSSKEWARLNVESNRFAFHIDNDDLKVVLRGSSVVDNTWYYIVGVWTKNSGDMKIYVNGVLDAQTTHPNKTTITAVNSETIGIRADIYYPECFQGNIAIAQIYNRALSAEEVLQNYNAQKGRFGL